jgi:hypothetical protein
MGAALIKLPYFLKVLHEAGQVFELPPNVVDFLYRPIDGKGLGNFNGGGLLLGGSTT